MNMLSKLKSGTCSNSIYFVGFFVLQLLGAAIAENDDPDEYAISPIVVEGESGVVTENTGSYKTDRATVGYKQPVDIKKVPQTVNVVTTQRLEDADANSIEDAAFLLPNLTTATGSGFVGSLYSRGHEVFTYNVDGAPRPFLSLYGSAPDLIFFDRIEVLSGPSGVFQGSGEPVGTINLVRKRAPYKFMGNGGLYYGSYDFYRGEADLGGPLTESGSVRTRVIGFGMEEDSFIDFAGRDRQGAYATLEVDFTESTTMSVGGIIEENDVSSHSGLPTFTDGSLLNVSMDTYIGAPWNENDQDTTEWFVELEHFFANGAVLKASSRRYDREADIKSALAQTPVDLVTGDFNLFVFAREWDEDSDYHDINLTIPFDTFDNSSEFTIGLDYRESDQMFKNNFDFSPGVQNINTFDARSIIEPDVEFPGVGPGFRLNTITESQESGVYAYGRFSLTEKLAVTLGGRYTDYDSETDDLGRMIESSDLSEDRFTPFVGLTYDINKNITVYTSYSEIFQPQAELNIEGSQLDPIEGKQVELGTKFSLLEDRVSGQLAIYRLEDENRADDDPMNVGFFIETGKDTTEGFEASLVGEIFPGLDLSLGYAYVDTDLETDPTSDHSGTAGLKYTLQEGRFANKLYTGANFRAASDFEALDGMVEIEAPGYGVTNIFGGYRFNEHLEAQLNINNVFNKKYIERVNTTTRGVFFGEPASATFSIKGSF